MAEDPNKSDMEDGLGKISQDIANSLNQAGSDADTGALAADILQNPAFLAALQSGIAGMVGQSSGLIESLPKSVIRRVNALRNLQKEQMKLEVQCHLETAAIEQKYLKLSEPLFEKRKAIVTGTYEPTDEECQYDGEEEEEEEDAEPGITEIKDGEAGESSTDGPEGEEKADGEGDKEEERKGIPSFWLTCLQNTAIGEVILDGDIDILHHLEDVSCEYLPEPATGFKIDFSFSDNEFFSNKVLTKTYHLNPQPDEDDLSYAGPVFVKSVGTKIEWKGDDKNVTVKTITKKQRKKTGAGAGAVRKVTKQVPTDSFFNFFSPPETPEEELSEAEMAELRERLLMDYELGDIFLSRIVQTAVLCFTGELDDDDDFDDEEQDEGDYDSDGDPDYVPPAGGDKPSECQQS